MSKDLIDKIMIQAEIDSLLNDTREEYHIFDRYSLSPMNEKLRFKNGVAKLPPAYKETKPLKSVLEAEGNGGEIVFEGVYFDSDEKIQVAIPGLNKLCFISQQKLNQLISKYGGKKLNVTVKGRKANYVCFAIDKKTLLSYCEFE